MCGVLVAALAQCLFTLVLYICGYDSFIVSAWCILGVVITGIYIVLDLVALGDNRQFGYDDYILGALMLYLDLVRLFYYILITFAKKD